MLEFTMFERLPIRSQAETLAKEGTVIAQRQHKGLTVTLYTLYNGFVELWSGNHVQVYSTFKETAKAGDILEPYLDTLEVADFFKNDL
ncbi:MAG: hypothetical protein LPK09_00615 [Hymenobacteraceae bacterium]|nr:hypothetical protein [Hymenobacteraceae bacterium]